MAFGPASSQARDVCISVQLPRFGEKLSMPGSQRGSLCKRPAVTHLLKARPLDGVLQPAVGDDLTQRLRPAVGDVLTRALQMMGLEPASDPLGCAWVSPCIWLCPGEEAGFWSDRIRAPAPHRQQQPARTSDLNWTKRCTASGPSAMNSLRMAASRPEKSSNARIAKLKTSTVSP